MRKPAAALAVAALTALALVAALAHGRGPAAANASSHREAPLISEDPSADNTDLYAFRSPDKPDTLTIVSNFIPGEDPAAGPNYYTFSPTARYDVYVDRNGDGRADVSYYFQFQRKAGQFFLGDTTQPYTVTRVENGKARIVARGTTPPDNIGPRTTPDYHALAAKAVTPLDGGGQVFAGQRDDPFFGDVGDIFDLLAIRKGTGSTGGGKDFLAGYAVHSIALQIPISQLDTASHTIGIWSAADRRRTAVEKNDDARKKKGRRASWVQVSRLGTPLINEVVIPTTLKDKWNRLGPSQDRQFVRYYRTPILAAVINKLYNLGVPETNRDDLVQVLLTGIPNVTFTGSTPADELRINLAVPVTPANKVSRLGVLGGDNQGFPNGRRLGDDVVDISEQAVGGFLVGHKLPLGDGVDDGDTQAMTAFPYVADPQSGAADTHGEQK
ncbi:MAG: DUF4331 domain-containing protein [Thermoleophilia bacterium]|nr:DUF4331 domain-containing protein [Thermoleophilia bacterium]